MEDTASGGKGWRDNGYAFQPLDAHDGDQAAEGLARRSAEQAKRLVGV